jgi:hypothetical protein
MAMLQIKVQDTKHIINCVLVISANTIAFRPPNMMIKFCAFKIFLSSGIRASGAAYL